MPFSLLCLPFVVPFVTLNLCLPWTVQRTIVLNRIGLWCCWLAHQTYTSCTAPLNSDNDRICSLSTFFAFHHQWSRDDRPYLSAFQKQFWCRNKYKNEILAGEIGSNWKGEVHPMHWMVSGRQWERFNICSYTKIAQKMCTNRGGRGTITGTARKYELGMTFLQERSKRRVGNSFGATFKRSGTAWVVNGHSSWFTTGTS